MSRSARLLVFTLILFLPLCAFAQVAVTLPDTSQTTTLTASVSEQATVTVPAAVTFTVSNVGLATASTNQSVTATSIVLNDGKSLQIQLEADAASFTAPTGGTVTWAAGDVTWNAATWTNSGVGSSGTLSSSAANTVATCAANATSCSTTNLQFTLAAKPTVNRAGNHTLSVHWHFNSV